MTKDELKPIDTSKYKITETGQVLKMTKDEMTNRISMALKDPTLLQGFEVICKENAELDCQMNRNKCCYSCVNATDKCFRKEIECPCEKYKSYKDENAELKEKLEVSEKLRDYWKSSSFDWRHKCTRRKSFKVAVKAQKQLTKAKEIIKDYMIISKGAHTTVCGVPEENRTIYVLKLNEEAEQFLNKE